VVSNLLKKLSHLIRRPVTEQPCSTDDHIRVGIFVILFGVIIILFSTLFLQQTYSWRKASPTITITKHDWKLLQTTPPTNICGTAASVNANCPAHPSNPRLWHSNEGRFTESGSVKKKPKKDFWIGAEINEAELKKAKSAQANELILGWVFGSFEVWVNGNRFASIAIETKSPTIIPLPISYLDEKNLKIAFLIHPDSEFGSADTLARPWSEGLATPEQSAAFRSAANFWKTSRPFALFLLNAFFSLLFVLLWRIHRKKQEYLYFAVYGAVCALVQLRLTDFFYGSFNASQTRAIDLFLYTSEGTFGLLMALSFARSRRKILHWGNFIALALPWILYFPLESMQMVNHLNLFLRKWYIPLAHILGAFACLLQAWELKSHNTSRINKTRLYHLYYFAIGMTVISALYFFQAHDWMSLVGQAISSRFAHFIILFLLGSIAMREYKEEKKLLERAHVSRYHRMDPLPQFISGAMLSVDLKGSERLFQISAKNEEMGNLVETCVSHLWSTVLANGGIVLQTDGDGLKAFFDKTDCKNPIQSALLTTDMMKTRIDEFRQQLQYQEIIPSENFPIEFRAGIALGEIKPTWQQVDTMKVAGWTDTGEQGPFVESSRLMEVERQLPEGTNISIVVLSEESTRLLPVETNLKGSWEVKSRRLVGKHNRIFLISAYKAQNTNTHNNTNKNENIAA